MSSFRIVIESEGMSLTQASVLLSQIKADLTKYPEAKLLSTEWAGVGNEI